MPPLPYENATSGRKALSETQALLKSFGCTAFGVMEQFADGMLIVQFTWRDRNVTIKASANGYAAAWLRHHPWSSRMRLSHADHKRKAMEQAQISVYSILRDWIKGQVTAIEVGILSFEGAFLGQILLPSGETVLERIERTELLALNAPNET